MPELHTLLTELAGGSRAESGCHSFRFFDAEEPGDIFLVSGWADERALRDHYQTPHYRRYRAAVGELLARPSDVTVHRISQNVHAVDPNPPDPGMFGSPWVHAALQESPPGGRPAQRRSVLSSERLVSTARPLSQAGAPAPAAARRAAA